MPIAAIVLTVLVFIAWWPIGLIVLAIFFWSKHMYWHRRYAMGWGGWGHCNGDWSPDQSRWPSHWQAKMERLQEKMDRVRSKMERRGGGGWWGPPTSGNRAFDDYRAETLRRLEEEQREFKEFLERLRFAKDRSEFDQFMTERRNRPNDQGNRPNDQGNRPNDQGPQPQQPQI
jgi:hypothetical protein